jgi:glycosyltransferase involved in cell wall biosynthesis
MRTEELHDLDQPLVSVITATYNASHMLPACLESVRSQDYPHIQHVVIDGGSTDDTVQILRAQPSDRVRWLSEPDAGIYDAWNKGLSRARGEWIAFLGADDIYLPGAIRAYMDLAMHSPELEYLSSRVRWIGSGGRVSIIGEPWQWPRFQRYMCTAHVGSMHRRSLFERLGRYDISYRSAADYELLLRAGGQLATAYLPQVTAAMMGGGMSDSTRALDEAKRAKTETGGRSHALALLEQVQAKTMFHARRLMSAPHG